jgi:LysR family carnitine catabolism transcriptional activator
MQELGAQCLTLSDSVERAIGVLTEPGNELSAAAQALFDILQQENLAARLSP